MHRPRTATVRREEPGWMRTGEPSTSSRIAGHDDARRLTRPHTGIDKQAFAQHEGYRLHGSGGPANPLTVEPCPRSPPSPPVRTPPGTWTATPPRCGCRATGGTWRPSGP